MGEGAAAQTSSVIYYLPVMRIANMLYKNNNAAFNAALLCRHMGCRLGQSKNTDMGSNYKFNELLKCR